jgi:hypothetical protein
MSTTHNIPHNESKRMYSGTIILLGTGIILIVVGSLTSPVLMGGGICAGLFGSFLPNIYRCIRRGN